MASKTDAIAILKQDHRDVEDLFEQFEDAATLSQQQKIAGQICEALRLHAEVEEEIFYPAAREAIEDSDLIDEAEVEHGSAKMLMEQIESGNLTPEMFRANVMVLKEYIQHHVEEEEKEIFKQVKASKLDLEALGEEIEMAKGESV